MVSKSRLFINAVRTAGSTLACEIIPPSSEFIIFVRCDENNSKVIFKTYKFALPNYSSLSLYFTSTNIQNTTHQIMYSKKENQQLKQEFWVTFAEKYPRKWLLYDTKIKDFSFKFYVDNRKAQVIIDIENRSLDLRKIYFEKIVSLKTILENDYTQNLVYEKDYTLESGKTISRIWVEMDNVSVSNKAYWDQIFNFFEEKMDAMERFFYEYQDYINDLETNV